MNELELSIIVPAYNAGKYIFECIDSILKQSFTNFELIIVNDGSKDNTFEQLNTFARQDNRVVLINLSENKGLFNARVTGYLCAKGKYIGWVDSDDIVDADMFEKLIAKANEGDYDCVYCDYRFFPKQSRLKNKWFKLYNGKNDCFFIDNNGQHWNKIVKKEILDKINYKYLEMHIQEGSYDFVLASCKSFGCVNEPLYSYRTSNTSMSKSYFKIQHYIDDIDLAVKMKETAISLNMDSQRLEYYDFNILYRRLIAAIIAVNVNDKQLYIEQKNIFKKNNFFKKYKMFIKMKFSSLKIFVIKNIFLKNYCLARILSKIIFK